MNFKERYKYDPNKDLLGRGGFSKVFKAHDQMLDRPVALKFFTSGAGEKYNVLSEIKRVIKFQHLNIVKYYDVAEVEVQGVHGEMEKMQVGIMEYVNGGDLYKFLKSKPDSRAFKGVVAGILKGLQFIHDNNLIHRDIKPENILMNKEGNEWVAKIADFGISKEIAKGQSGASALMGTVEYMAPEQFNPQKFGIGGKLTTNVDLWSFGVILHETFSGQPFFGKRSQGVSMEQIMRNIYEKGLPVHFENVPEPYQSIIKRCLMKNAAERAQDAKELLELLEKKTSSTATTHIPITSIGKPAGASGKAGSGRISKPTGPASPSPAYGKSSSELKWNKQQTPSSEVTAGKKTSALVFIIPLVILLLGGGAFALYKFTSANAGQPVAVEETNQPEEIKTEFQNPSQPVTNHEEEKNEKLFIDRVTKANTYFLSNDYVMAKEFYEKAKELKPDNAHVKEQLEKLNEYFTSQGEKTAWEQAKIAGTRIAYEDFLNKYPSGKYNQEARKAIDNCAMFFENNNQFGDRKFKAGSFEAAIAYYDKALKNATKEQQLIVNRKIDDCWKLKVGKNSTETSDTSTPE